MRPTLDEVADAEKPVPRGVELECGECPVQSAETPVYVADDEVATQPIGGNVLDRANTHVTAPRQPTPGRGNNAMAYPLSDWIGVVRHQTASTGYCS